MEGLIISLGFVLLAIPVAVIALIVGHFGQKRRLEDVEGQLYAARREIADLRFSIGREEEPPTGAETPSQSAAAPEMPPKVKAEAMQTPEAKAPPPVPPKPAATPSPPPPQPTPRPSPVADALAKLGPWLQENWFYAVSAVSLALAGIFLVQYGMENGLLPPRARVAVALAFGAVLIGAGEFLRRRFGDGTDSATAYLPSVFSGAGIVTLFGAILSARMLYDLIGGTPAMIGMVAVALVAMVLGWLHGPLLVAIGVIGAFGAPAVLGSSNSDASPLFGYFAIIAALGLGVDTIRRWGWISVLTLVLAFIVGWGLLLSDDDLVWAAIVYFTALSIFAILIPARGLTPDQAGPALMQAILARRSGADAIGRPGFAALMALGSVAATSASLMVMAFTPETELWLSMACLAGLALLLTLWSGRAKGLQDAALLPGLALLVSVWMQGAGRSDTYRAFSRAYAETPEADFPWAVTALVVMGVLISVAAAWRSLQGGGLRHVWAAHAAVYGAAMAILLEVSWTPAGVIGAYPWALHAAALAALMVLLAERFARADGPARLRTSFAVMSALSCLAFAFVIVLNAAALTVALAVTVVVAAALDRKWDLPTLSYFIAAGVVTLGYRLIVDPGLEAGRDDPLSQMLLAYGGTLAALLGALWLLRTRVRPLAQLMLESAAWSTGGTLVSLLLLRWIDSVTPIRVDSHWSLGLFGAIWLGLALAQMQRTPLGGALRNIRWALAGIFALIGGFSVLMAVTEANPLFDFGVSAHVLGPPLLNTLAAAYLLPALVLLVGAWRLRDLDHRIRLALAAIGATLSVLWVILTIRHTWQGGAAMNLREGIGQPELYTYTVGLLVLGAGLFYQSLARKDGLMRRAGLVVIGLAVAKVFLVDISGLEGLTRVFSLLVLGLSLAALAWLNRWAQAQSGGGSSQEGGQPPVLPDPPGDI